MWRCFSEVNIFRGRKGVFSTYVEVFPSPYLGRVCYKSFLHVCGGVSGSGTYPTLRLPFSPRMWRCFLFSGRARPGIAVFSTYVEVFLILSILDEDAVSFLHVCGGVSLMKKNIILSSEFSPRMWRCFSIGDCIPYHGRVFSTYVEVFLPRDP